MKLSYNLILIFILAYLLSSHALASNKVGNGGDGVFCKLGEKNTGRLLDFYEADLSPADKERDPYSIAKKQFNKLEGVAPQLHEIYLKRLKDLPEEIDDKAEIDLTDIKDSKHLFKPKNKDCKVEQLAIRKIKVMKGEKRFLISKDLWKLLKPVDQAGLLTHEIIYEHFSRLGEADSQKARRMNRYLYSHTELNAKDFWLFIKDLEIPIYP